MVFIVILLVLFVLGATLTIIFNALVSLKNQIDRAWANIEVILKQRYDEVPQLLEVIEQTAQYEQKTIQKILDARTHFGRAQTIDAKIDAANQMSQALGGLVALGEAYPDLKATQSFQQLQNRVSEFENTIADRREMFNETVTNFNTRIAQFPDLFFARFLGYTERNLYRPPESETVRPSLKIKNVV